MLVASACWGMATAADHEIRWFQQSMQRLSLQDDVATRRITLDWYALVQHLKSESLPAQLDWVNSYINKIPYREDLVQWGENDYWATPEELFRAGHGDCEDLAIAKYFTLRVLGVDDNHLRLLFVKQRETSRPHMVLAVLRQSVWWVLDNTTAAILPLEQRHDLEPVYGFNGDSLWITRAASRNDLVGPALRIGHWAALWSRLR